MSHPEAINRRLHPKAIETGRRIAEQLLRDKLLAKIINKIECTLSIMKT